MTYSHLYKNRIHTRTRQQLRNWVHETSMRQHKELANSYGVAELKAYPMTRISQGPYLHGARAPPWPSHARQSKNRDNGCRDLPRGSARCPPSPRDSASGAGAVTSYSLSPSLQFPPRTPAAPPGLAAPRCPRAAHCTSGPALQGPCVKRKPACAHRQAGTARARRGRELAGSEGPRGACSRRRRSGPLRLPLTECAWASVPAPRHARTTADSGGSWLGSR